MNSRSVLVESERSASEYLKGEVGEVPPHSVTMERYNPEISSALHTIRRKALSDGVLSKKVKELLRIAASASLRLPKEPFARLHAYAAVKAGATPKEIHEAVEVALLVCGISSYAEYGYAVVEEAEKLTRKGIAADEPRR